MKAASSRAVTLDQKSLPAAATHLSLVSKSADSLPVPGEERLERDFWNSPPAYSIPPTYSEPPGPVHGPPSRLRRIGATLLFVALFGGVLALLTIAGLTKLGVSSWAELRALPNQAGWY